MRLYGIATFHYSKKFSPTEVLFFHDYYILRATLIHWRIQKIKGQVPIFKNGRNNIQKSFLQNF